MADQTQWMRRDRQILHDRDALGLSFRQIGRRHRLSGQRISQIYRRAKARQVQAAKVAAATVRFERVIPPQVHTSSTPVLRVWPGSPVPMAWPLHLTWTPREQFYEFQFERTAD